MSSSPLTKQAASAWSFPRFHPLVALVVSAGGVFGSLVRHWIGVRWPTSTGSLPWSTLIINVSGSFLIGVLLVLVTERQVHPLLRPLLGTGFLGGYTTMSAYATDGVDLLRQGEFKAAGFYLVGTLLGALVATALAMALTRRGLQFLPTRPDR